MNKKLSAFTLSGLIIGPILGSGVILLPPLIYNLVGDYSLFIWASILILGFIFALIFGKLSILYPGDGGVSLATKHAMGKKYQLLTSFYLICAVFFGPVAVLLIAAEFLHVYFQNINIVFLALGIYLFTYLLLLIRIDFLGKIMLFASSLITVIFTISSIMVLFEAKDFTLNIPSVAFKEQGHAFLIVFWSIVGWEVIGNYSKDVKSNYSLKYGVIFSAVIISIVYALMALAICVGNFPSQTKEFKLVYLIQPLFHQYSNFVLLIMSMILCVGTLVLFVGGVSRLISSLNFFSYTSKHLKNNAPIGALNVLSFIYCITLFLVYLGFLSLDELVAFADGFFIANAIIGLITAVILFKFGYLKYFAVLLSMIFFVILLSSNPLILGLIFVLFLLTYLKK